MGCPDMSALQAKYKKSVDDYVVVVKKLRDLGIGIPQTEFMVLWHSAETAMDKCVEAHRILQHHISDHGCSLPRVTAASA